MKNGSQQTLIIIKIMKKVLFTAFLAVSCSVFSQDYSIPAASPRQKIEQSFSISKVTVDYGRPGVKGRKIFGELVPYGKVWRAGANSSTKITFGQDVVFGGKELPAGTYGLFVIANEKDWKIILNKDSQSWGAYSYDEKLNVLEVTVPVQKLSEKKEFFDIYLEPVDDNSLTLVFKWDNVKTEVPVKASKPEVINQVIEKLKEAKKIQADAAKK